MYPARTADNYVSRPENKQNYKIYHVCKQNVYHNGEWYNRQLRKEKVRVSENILHAINGIKQHILHAINGIKHQEQGTKSNEKTEKTYPPKLATYKGLNNMVMVSKLRRYFSSNQRPIKHMLTVHAPRLGIYGLNFSMYFIAIWENCAAPRKGEARALFVSYILDGLS